MISKKLYILIFLSALIILSSLMYILKKATTLPINPQPSPFPTITPAVFSSPTPLPPPQSLQDQLKIQTEADKNFADRQNEVLRNYPWYNSLPIQTNKYFVYFDLKNKMLIALLYPKQSSSISINSQVEEFKAEITLRLKNLVPIFMRKNLLNKPQAIHGTKA